MAPARVALAAAAMLCFFAAASARGLLDDAANATEAVSGEDIVPIMPAMTMLTAGPGESSGMNRMLRPAAFMPGNAASNASVAMGFLMAPLMLQRGPMGARFNAPPLNDTVPAELAGLPPRVHRALGFAPLTAKPPAGAPHRVSSMAKSDDKKPGIFSRG